MDNVMVAMSGGVDSAAAAIKLIDAGYLCSGATMKVSDYANDESAYAAETARFLGIKHHIFDMRDIFEQTVIANFIEAYSSGATPNPCIICNKKIKFGAFIKCAEDLGFSKIATGHYARIFFDGSRYLIKKAKDPAKDQTYMLYTLSQDQLSRTIFPLGDMNKDECRALAESSGLPCHSKKESQDICFIPDGKYARFIKDICGKDYPPGNFIDKSGNILGKHKGIIHYTVGQRKGLEIAFGTPMYVADKDASANTVTLSTDSDLYSKRIIARSVNFIPFDTLNGRIRITAKLRYRHEPAPAFAEMIAPDTMCVEFDSPQRAAAKGQSLVMYDGDILVGGGIIS